MKLCASSIITSGRENKVERCIKPHAHAGLCLFKEEKERSYLYDGKNGKRGVTASPLSVVIPEDDPELAQFIRDSNALKTMVEHKWTAWLDDREYGIVGTGGTEVEAIKALAEQHKEATQ